MTAAVEPGRVSGPEKERTWTLPTSCLYVTQLTSSSDVASLFRQANLKALQASLQFPELWFEADMLRRLVYKNHNQHRSSLMMRHIRAVLRQLSLLQALALPCVLSDLEHMIQLASTRSTTTHPPRSQLVAAASRLTHRVACQEAGAVVMGRLQGGCMLSQQLVRSCMEAGQHLAAQVAKTFFMPLCITALSMMSRIQSLSMQLLTCCISAYNSLAGLLPLLPAASASGPAPPATHRPLLNQLPCSLHCTWHGQAPQVSQQQDSSSAQGQQQGWIQAKAAELWQEYGLMQGLECQYVGPVGGDAPVAAATHLEPVQPAPAHTGPQPSSMLLDATTGAAAGPAHVSTQSGDVSNVRKRHKGTQQVGEQSGSGMNRKALKTGGLKPAAVPALTAPGAQAGSKRNSFFDLMATTTTTTTNLGGQLHHKPSSVAATAGSSLPAAFIDKGRSGGEEGGEAAGLHRCEVPVYAMTRPGLSLGLGRKLTAAAAETPVEPRPVVQTADGDKGGHQASVTVATAQPVTTATSTQQLVAVAHATAPAHTPAVPAEMKRVLPPQAVLNPASLLATPSSTAAVKPAFVRVQGGGGDRMPTKYASDKLNTTGRGKQVTKQGGEVPAGGISGGGVKSSWEDLLLGPAPAPAPHAAHALPGVKGKKRKAPGGGDNSRVKLAAGVGDGILDMLLGK